LVLEVEQKPARGEGKAKEVGDMGGKKWRKKGPLSSAASEGPRGAKVSQVNKGRTISAAGGERVVSFESPMDAEEERRRKKNAKRKRRMQKAKPVFKGQAGQKRQRRN
jgi:hypothetical protein